MAGLTLFNPWVLLAWAGSLLVALVIGYTSNDQAATVEAAYEHASRVAVEARGQRIAQAREAERALRDAQEAERKKAHAEYQSLLARHDDLRRELRNRPERPAPAGAPDVHQRPPTAGAPGPGCTGAGLFRDDAEFLARYSAAALKLKSQLLACHADYERARQALRQQGGLKPPVRDSP